MILKSTEETVKKCVDLLQKVSQVLPMMKIKIVEFTDGGSGVGVSNRDAERFMKCNTDYFIQHHLTK